MLVVRCRSLTLTAGKVRAVRRYTAEMIDWLAVYDATTDRCFYIPAGDLGDGRNTMTLRMTPARNGQRRGIRMATDFEALPDAATATTVISPPPRGRGANGNTRPLQG